MAAAPLVMMGLGSVGQAFGALKGGEADAEAAFQNQLMSVQNAAISRQQAEEDARVHRVAASKVIGEARASYGASGVAANSASAVDVLAESARNAEMDALKIKHQGELKARGYNMEAQGYAAAGRNARTLGYIGAASSLLSGGAQILKRSG